jgi:hypothetical protein
LDTTDLEVGVVLVGERGSGSLGKGRVKRDRGCRASVSASSPQVDSTWRIHFFA